LQTKRFLRNSIITRLVDVKNRTKSVLTELTNYYYIFKGILLFTVTTLLLKVGVKEGPPCRGDPARPDMTSGAKRPSIHGIPEVGISSCRSQESIRTDPDQAGS